MTPIRVVNRTRGTMLGNRVRLADGLASRTRGFLFRPEPATGEGILLSPCKAVHMFGVPYPLDVVFINERGLVVAVYPELAPWRWSSLHAHALHALEVPAGTIRSTGTRVGDSLSWTVAEEEHDAGAEETTPREEPEGPLEAPAAGAPPQREAPTRSRPQPVRRPA